jgi:hypothetical protein
MATPADCIEYTGEDLPKPAFQVGQEVIFTLREMDGTWFDRLYLEHTIRRLRKVLDNPSFRKNTKLTSNRMPDYNKDQIRDLMAVFRSAKGATVRIAGIAPWSMHVVDNEGYNQCYLKNGHCHSGISYEYFMCIYYMKGNCECAMVTGIPFPEYCFKPIPTE